MTPLISRTKAPPTQRPSVVSALIRSVSGRYRSTSVMVRCAESVAMMTSRFIRCFSDAILILERLRLTG